MMHKHFIYLLFPGRGGVSSLKKFLLQLPGLQTSIFDAICVCVLQTEKKEEKQSTRIFGMN